MMIPLFILFAIVMAVAYNKKGSSPDSVSEVAYILPKWVFTIWIAAMGLLLMPGLMENLPENLKWVGFLVVACSFGVAATPYYKAEARTLHYVGGILCAVLSLFIVAMLRPWLLTMWVVVPFLPKRRMFLAAETMVYLQLILAI